MSKQEFTDYKFVMTGGFTIKDAKPLTGVHGDIVGLELSNGDEIRPVLSFEILRKSTKDYEDISEGSFDDLGIDLFDYDTRYLEDL